MNRPELQAEVERWLRYAKEDLHAAEAGLAESIPRHTCWLSQQAAEKSLKAALVLAGVDFPFRHDLDSLRNLLPDGWSVKELLPDLAELTEWAVEARYPGDWPEATREDAVKAVAQAHTAYNQVIEDLGHHGLQGKPRK